MVADSGVGGAAAAQDIVCRAAIAWEAEKPLEVVDITVAPPQVSAIAFTFHHYGCCLPGPEAVDGPGSSVGVAGVSSGGK